MLTNNKLRQTFLFILLFSGFSHVASAQERKPDFMDHVVVVQFAPGIPIGETAAKTNLSGFDRKAARYDVYRIERVYPFLDYVEPTPETAEDLAALRDTYYVRYRADENPIQVSEDFALAQHVIYSEPVLRMRRYESSRTQADPDDPQYEKQPYLDLVRLPEAWDMVKAEDADEPVVIAIVDTGGDWDHEDLLANVWTNEDEIPGNGMDDDQNGFIDDVHGVNLGNKDQNDNDPTPEDDPDMTKGTGHGTAVAGTASAVTDNGTGIAGAAWNAKLMHVNTFCEEEEICGGFRGILYAAANGADIINTSWGGFAGDAELQLANRSLNVATDMGALIVAAAGNDHRNNDIYWDYPSGHPRVLSVGATEQNSRKLSEFSNYGRTVDIFAPGVDITTTIPDNKYDTVSGTSLSAPLVAGIAALVKTQFPDMSPDSLREQLRLSSENIEADNPQYTGQFSGGMVNAEAGLKAVTLPAVRVKEWSWEDEDGDNEIAPGEEVTVQVTFVNYLADAQQLTVELIPLEPYPYMTLLDAKKSIGALRNKASTTVTFRFSVAADVLPNRRAYFSVQIRDGAFTDAPDALAFHQINARIDLMHEALSALFQSTNGNDWIENSGWNTTTVPTNVEQLSRWFGVYVVNGSVEMILLPGNNLKGVLPAELGKALGLRNLILASNSISGPIPRELAQLVDLEALILGLNQLTGSIPPELAQLSRLRLLSFELNQLTGSIPPELAQLPVLEALALSDNQLTGSIPPELGQLSELQILQLGRNQLTGAIPSELGQLSSLMKLSLNQNQLTGTVPPELGQLSALKELDLSKNALTGSLPRSLMQLDNLEAILFEGQELCAPQDNEFQEWLKKIDFVLGETCKTVAIEETDARESLPEKFVVHSNYPNPFRTTTQLTFDLPRQSQVSVEVIDVIGRRVMNAPERTMSAGWSQRIELNGESLPPGLYLYRLIADSPSGNSVQVGRFVRIR